MQDRLCFIQFIHPGGEHTPDCGNMKTWNRGKHKRKFMTAEGRYLDGGKVLSDNIIFWGEWEPESEVVTRIAASVVNGPTNLYRPFYRRPSSYVGLQNTDPFVFGEQFHYCICQQHAKGRPTQMRNLERGSVILFGSCLNDQFVLDTVFVVSHYWIDHCRNDHRKLLQDHVSDTYWDVVLSPLYPEDPGAECSKCGGDQSDCSFRLYFGATWEQPIDGMFSFFPCMAEAVSSVGFARPVIVLPDQITNDLNEGRKHTYVRSLGDMALLWKEVSEQVVSQGLHLGVRAELPLRDNP